MKFFSVILFGLFLTSCVTTTQYSKMTDLSSDEESAKIFVIRKSILATAIPMKIYQDGELVGRLGPKGYIAWEVEKEGPIFITSSSPENKDHFKIDVQKGKTYYLKQKAKPGYFVARSGLELMEPEKARKAINKLKEPKVNYTTR